MNPIKIIFFTISLIAHLHIYSCELRQMTDYTFIINNQNYQILKDSMEAINLAVKTGPQGNYLYKWQCHVLKQYNLIRKTLQLTSAYKLIPEQFDAVFLSTVNIKLKAFEQYKEINKGSTIVDL